MRPFPLPELFSGGAADAAPPGRRSDPVRDHPGQRLERWRRSLDGADRLERLEPRRAGQRRSLPRPSPRGTDRHAALRLLADLRRAATPAGSLPERVDARTGIPRSTTPLAWSHAFAILALRELWPDP